ncbi:Transposase [Mycetohabitans rhizoxinica HKI 454]|uniref:Transposase n=1 Tax=Mycetohabitans rhizoxinica (strain DSM 19002 / CIP 109453 / HKI 454) TaxID=882378 RepID=E5ARJ8_MYCRK|nr:Transposase [Mycetohabitans rhizoxinica HKI 454]
MYVRDDSRSGSAQPAAVWFAYSPERKGIHPQTHLAGFEGIVQADAYVEPPARTGFCSHVETRT